MTGAGLVLHEVSLIAERVAPIANFSDFAHEARVFELAKQLRSAMLDMEASAIAIAAAEKDAA
jgi:hypothetical protein